MRFWENFWSMGFMVVGFVLPYVIVHLYFVWNGNWDYYHYVTYIAPGSYSSSHHLPSVLDFNFKALLMYSPFVLMGILSWKQGQLESSFKLLILLLLVFDVMAVNLTGKPFKHYLLQLAIPISLIAGEAYHLPYLKRYFDRRLFHRIAIALTISYAIVIGIVYGFYRFDSARELVQFFEKRIEKEDTLYAADSPTILYWYFDKKSPTKYVHSTLMVFPHHIKELGIDIENELGQILMERPTYIVLSDRYPHKWFIAQVKERYQQVADLEKYSVFRLNE